MLLKIGFTLFCLGIATADSERASIPTALVIIGAVLVCMGKGE